MKVKVNFFLFFIGISLQKNLKSISSSSGSNMSHLIFFLTTIYLSTVTGKLSFLGKLTQGLTNEFNKGVIAFGSGQCE